MSTVAYKCPNCASSLSFDGASGKLLCAACGSQFDLAAMEAMYAAQTGNGIDFETPTEGYAAADVAQLKAYNCKNCGAELITEGTTTATECPYCGSPTILPDRIDGGIRPELVVPFTISKEQAQKLFEEYFRARSCCPTCSRKTTGSPRSASCMCPTGSLTAMRMPPSSTMPKSATPPAPTSGRPRPLRITSLPVAAA